MDSSTSVTFANRPKSSGEKIVIKSLLILKEISFFCPLRNRNKNFNQIAWNRFLFHASFVQPLHNIQTSEGGKEREVGESRAIRFVSPCIRFIPTDSFPTHYSIYLRSHNLRLEHSCFLLIRLPQGKKRSPRISQVGGEVRHFTGGRFGGVCVCGGGLWQSLIRTTDQQPLWIPSDM